MKELNYKIKNILFFLAGACLMIFGYSREAANERSDNRQYPSDRKEKTKDHPVKIEPDVPEISSGTQ